MPGSESVIDVDDFPAVFACMPAALLVILPDAPRFTIGAATDAYLHATLQTREGLIGQSLFDAFPDANPSNPVRSGVANLRASLESVLRTGTMHLMPVQRYDLRRPDGTWEERHWAPRNTPVMGPDGALRYLVHFVEDVTDRVHAEAERTRLDTSLAAEREQVRATLLQAMTPMALLVGPEHRVELFNEAYRRVSGGRDITGLTYREAFPELEGQPFFDIQDRVYATGEPWEARAVPVRYDRLGRGVEDAYFDLRYEPVRNTDGEVTALLNYGVDVTEQTQARLAAEQALAQAEAANRAKAEFLAMMSHELRTPLNAIGGYAQLMELGIHGPVTSEQVAALDRIQRGQQHLLGLINAVLNYAKLEAGHVEYVAVDVPAASLLDEVAALIAPQARTQGLMVILDADTPGSSEGALTARADPEKVRQVLLNLLSNAVKFTAPGGMITMGCAPAAEGEVAFTVTDTGRGIPPDQLERVFAPFVQVDQRLTRTQDGTGLGLAISRDLARGMGGDLTVTSTLGVGSTFTLTLPRA